MSSSTLRVGLIGCGGILQSFHGPAYLALPDLIEITALADPVPANLQWARSALDVPEQACYPDLKDMLRQAQLDVVVVATPHMLHAEHAIAALEAGTAVISEKPMALSLSQADQILDVASRTGRPYTVVHNFLDVPGTRQAVSMVRAGHLGEAAFGRTKALFRKRGQDQVDPALNWRASLQAGGGCINDSLYHEIYITEALMNSPVRYVQAQVKTQHFDFDVDDLAILLLEHANGAVSTVSGSWWVSGAGHGEQSNLAEAHGPKGSVRILGRGRALFYKSDAEDSWQEAPLEPEHQPSSDPRTWSGHAGYFARTFAALAHQTPLPVSGHDARHNLAIITAARMATAERRAICPDSL